MAFVIRLVVVSLLVLVVAAPVATRGVLGGDAVLEVAGTTHDDPAADTDHARLHQHKESLTSPVSDHVPDQRLANVPCTDGTAGPFPCDGIDLMSFVPASEFVGVEPSADPGISDVWGWTDQKTGHEYVMLGASNGLHFFRVTDPTRPVHLGRLANTAAVQQIWHDTKVFADHAFVVSESNPHGMRIFDLTRLRGTTRPQLWTEDARYPLPSAAHNVEINTETGYAYIVGGNAGLAVPDRCLSGLHMVDINTPKEPTFAGCYAEDGGPGTLGRLLMLGEASPAAYVHDTQCVVYRGPDTRYAGREICVNASETHVAIADVTDKANPRTISVVSYDHVGYTHQGWLTEDQRYFILGDELDEVEHDEVEKSRNILFDVTDLENPKVAGEHSFDTASITHNIYTKGHRAYHSNYTSGLRVTHTAPVASGRLNELAFFDTYPPDDEPTFDGSWSNYPFFDSGTIAVSGIDEGLFLLRPQPGR